MARILAVADSFDAMTSSRPYRVGMRLDKTRAIMMEGAGVQWDRDIVMLFWNWLDSQVRSDENEEVIPINLMKRLLPMFSKRSLACRTLTNSDLVVIPRLSVDHI